MYKHVALSAHAVCILSCCSYALLHRRTCQKECLVYKDLNNISLILSCSRSLSFSLSLSLSLYARERERERENWLAIWKNWTEIRPNATLTQNIVSYSVLHHTQNQQEKCWLAVQVMIWSSTKFSCHHIPVLLQNWRCNQIWSQGSSALHIVHFQHHLQLEEIKDVNVNFVVWI